MSSRRHRYTGNALPETLILELLSRLPIKSIINCTCVCKNWSNLVSDPYFIQLHLTRSSEALLINERTTSDITRRNPGSLKWADMIIQEEAAGNYHLDFIKTLDLNRFSLREEGEAPMVNLFETLQVGSVNGLICYAHPLGDICLINPVLPEFMFLPKPLLDLNLISSGFGVSMVGEYKVIRICSRRVSNEVGYKIEIEVYTLGVDRWRCLEDTSYNLASLTQEVDSGVFVNGHVYWIISGRIYGFDLNAETFKLFPSPPRPGNNQTHYKVLGVVKGCLSWILWCGVRLEVWVMKGESWCKEIAIHGGYSNPCLELLITCKPSCVIDGLNGTSILIFHDYQKKKVVPYCLDTKTFLNLNLHGGNVEAIKSYRPSFVKLRN